MSFKDRILSRFSNRQDNEPLFVPDLTLWYDWHKSRGMLPLRWKDHTLVEISRAIDVPVWWPIRPWRITTPGIEVTTTQTDAERIVHVNTKQGTLSARWVLGPDGDWWQREYYVKSPDDLPAALEMARARTYILDTEGLHNARKCVGDDGIVALTLPRRPYSDLLHEFLGWSEGLLMLREPSVQEILNALEEAILPLVDEIALLPGAIVLSPDNLDGQFISPRQFAKHLEQSYRQTIARLHARDKYLVVHIGGPTHHLLRYLAGTGIDCLEGISGPPQSNADLTEARELVGDKAVLWGGIPQDYLLDEHTQEAFAAAVDKAASHAKKDPGVILGIADHVPVHANLERLGQISSLVAAN